MKITELEPTIEGRYGKAWVMMTGKMHDEDTTVKGFVVEASWAHPLWKHYNISIISLAEVEGVRSAEIRLPNATHEVFVIALNPDHIPEVDKVNHILTPINFTGQFIADSDEQAMLILDDTVTDVINGTLSPDTDFRSMWRLRFPEVGE